MATISPPLQSVEHPPSAHKRTYQACIPCRRRKVRCDLGPVDNPHDPPCVRCRREKKDCFFTETRRKRKADEDGARDLSAEFVSRNRRSQVDGHGIREEGASGTQDDDRTSQEYDSYNDMQGAGEAQDGRERKRTSLHLNPLGRPATWNASIRMDKSMPEGREVTNETAAALFKSPIHNPGDALHLLVDAVARTGDLDRQRNQELSKAFEDGRRQSGNPLRPFGGAPGRDAVSLAIDPTIAGSTGRDGNLKREGMEEALSAWSRFRFVRAGWLTANEAVSYIDYFYEHLAPLTPIAPPDFHSPSSHPKLLSEEPMLTLTLLTITSRFMKLRGPASQSRSFIIHEKLWMYLQGMITRMFWGQEQFGGGFCGAGSGKATPFGTISGGLRTLGSIESLLLLSDWHPRSMHFPPGDDGDDIVVPLLPESENHEALLSALPGNPYAGWTEPALRSDKMCWSLVSFAYTLSYELGIFDSLIDHGKWYPFPQAKTANESSRANRIGRVLHIYVSQTCGRLGFPNILPHKGTENDVDYMKMNLHLRDPIDLDGTDRTTENVQRAWAEITALMRQSNAEMFESKAMTRDKIQKGEYLKFLEAHGPRLADWKARFERMDVPPLSRTLLMIEFEYTRTYVNSLSLQAVLEECATSEEASAANSGGMPANSGHTPPALVSSKVVEMRKENEPYIKAVVDASRSLLRHVIDGLVPNNGLKHAPVRTHFRILSGAMFLLKTFALGDKEEEVAISMQLLDDTVRVLRKYIVDDVHLSLRIADLLAGLTASIRTKFVRLTVQRPNNSKRPVQHQRKTSQASSKQSKPLSSPIRKQSLLSPRQTANNNIPNIDYLRTQGPLAGISTTLIDPNDSTITIMPPPDYIYHTGPNSSYPATSSPIVYNANVNSLSPHQHYLQPAQDFQSPTSSQGSHQQLQQNNMFGPSEHNYDWLTLDVNPLLQQGQNANNGGAGTGIGMGSWAGAFGPEIGESLEMLGMLADNSYVFGGGEGDVGSGWG